METDQILDTATRAIESFSDWMTGTVDPVAGRSSHLELDEWRKELDLIRSLIERPDRVRIALVGTTGAGKSTFLNAVLGQEVLPVGVMQPTTAFVTSVSFSRGPGYQVAVRFCSAQEWRHDLESLAAVIRPGDDEGEAERTESKRLVDAARKRIQAVYGIKPDEDLDPDELLNRALPPEADRVFAAGSVVERQFPEVKEMLKYLRQLIRGESTLWPLVKQVNISGPYECLKGGLELVDLPGLNDPNEARVEVTREFLRTSPCVWVIFSMVRGLTDDIQRILREERLLRTLVLSGTYGALSLVGTKADDVDTNIAPQLGLDEDCSIEELVDAYRQQTVVEARKQLEQMVSDLASPEEQGKTFDRMLGMARNVTVHATSANAYIKIKGIGRLRRDYGIYEEQETGFPGVHQHLKSIAEQAGTDFNARMALKRLDQLGEEISFFFRAKAQAITPEVEQARVRIQNELGELTSTIHESHNNARNRLKLYREQFLGKVEPLFTSSVRGISRVCEDWQGIHWASLRATVQRDGTFKSPSTGRLYDLNGDLTEPLLAQLPVSWERYFTDDLGRVTEEFVVQVKESGKNFCGRVRLIIDLVFGRNDESMEKQLAWFQEKVSLLAEAASTRLVSAVTARRSELASKVPLVARSRMLPAYSGAKTESGSGMKKRILGRISPAALESAQPIYSTIQTDLLEGLNDLEVIIVRMFSDLAEAANEQARIVAHNASVDIDDAAIDPDVKAILDSIPRVR